MKVACRNPHVLCAHISELMDPLVRYVTTGTCMRVALTCKTLYFAILNRLRERVLQCMRAPLSRLPIFKMPCKHKCTENTSFFVQDSQKDGYKVVRCTRCLHSIGVRDWRIPSSVWYVSPPHETVVEQIMSAAGARHSIFYAGSLE